MLTYLFLTHLEIYFNFHMLVNLLTFEKPFETYTFRESISNIYFQNQWQSLSVNEKWFSILFDCNLNKKQRKISTIYNQ